MIFDNRTYPSWPRPGDKLVALENPPKWFYPHYTDIVEDGLANIKPGQEYTVKKCNIYSSWCAVWLEELPDRTEGEERRFHLSFFKWNPKTK